MKDSIYPKHPQEMTDLEMIDLYIDFDNVAPDPRILQHLSSRNLVWTVDYNTGTKQERKAQARARLADKGKYIGDPEIEQIADKMSRIKILQEHIYYTRPSEAMLLKSYSDALSALCTELLAYFNEK